MGLGKTIQAISVAYFYKTEWPLLIVVPSSMRYPWIEELERWLPDVQPYDINLISSGTDVRNVSGCRISVVGYGLFRNDSETLVKTLTKQAFKVVIVDESHYMKNRKAARTKVLMPLLHNAKRVLLLTGTPALARPAELFTQIDSIQEGLMGSWSDFTKRYCNAHWHHFGRQKMWDTSGASNLDELHRRLIQTVMIRREKSQVLTQLPPKRRQKVPFELNDSQDKKELDKCWSLLDKVIRPSQSVEPSHTANPGFEVKKLATQMYNLTGKAKIGAVCEYIKMLLDNQDLKFLVFAHHKEVMTALAQTVSAYSKEHQKPMKYIKIDGDVPSSERMHLVKQFQTDNSTRVAILSILAAGTGLTLTAASQVVFAELHWTPGILEQCEDRAHRIGQLNAIHVHYLVARGTIDEWLWCALSKKVNVLSSTLNGRLEHLRMDEKGAEDVEFLKHAVAWLPSNRDLLDDEAVYFSNKTTSKDIRSYFTPSHTKASKRKRDNVSPCRLPDTPSDPQTVSSTILNSTRVTCSVNEDDFQADKKRRLCDDFSSKELGRQSDDSQNTSCADTSRTLECDARDRYPEIKSIRKQRYRKRSTCVDNEESSHQCTRRSDGVDEREKDLFLDKSQSPKSSSQHNDPSSCSKAESGWSCSACTFQNHVDLPFCEICSTPSKTAKVQSKTVKRGHSNMILGGRCQTHSGNYGVDENNTAHATVDLFPSCQQSCTAVSASCTIDNQQDQILSKSDKHSEEYNNMVDMPFKSKYCLTDNNLGVLHEKKDVEDPECDNSASNQEPACDIDEADCIKPQSKTATENWKCLNTLCGCINSTDDSQCKVCCTQRSSFTSNPTPSEDLITTSNNEFKTSDEVSEMSHEPVQVLEEHQSKEPILNSSASETVEGPVYESFLYCLSKHTDRIYMYDQDGSPLNCSFLAIDLQHRDLDSLPRVLHIHHNMQIALHFLREWNSLNEVKRKQLRKTGEMFASPLKALQTLKDAQHYQPCTKRHITKNDLAKAARERAESVDGGLRVIMKASCTKRKLDQKVEPHSIPDHNQPSGSKSAVCQSKPLSLDSNVQLTRGTYIQALDGEGRPLCVFCGNVTCGTSGLAQHNEVWDQRYCSESCKEEHKIRWKSSKYVRQQLLEAEHGKCQMCGLGAQQLYHQIKDAAKADRKEILEHSAFSQLPAPRLNDIIRNPSSGQFWHADHIIAVMDGGGLCSLDNFRTLCVICHEKVTAQQNVRRRNQRKSAGIPDIRSFFKP